MDTSQKTESIKDLMDEIRLKKIVLPEFQRDFVWDEPKTYDLFDSLIRDIFIGSLIYGIPSFELTVRELDTRPRKGNGSREKLKLHSLSKKEVNERVKTGGFRLLLDGQQRATSLARALNGVDPVWIMLKNGDDYHAGKKPTIEKATLEAALYEVGGRESDERLSIKLADVYLMLNGGYPRERDKGQLLANSRYAKALELKDTETVLTSSLFDEYLHFASALQDLLKSEKLLSYYMLDTDEEKFSLFFERSNSRGIQLDFIDILAAKLYAGFNLRKNAEAFADANPSLTLRREVIVRAIAFIVSDAKDLNRSFILSSLSASHFNEHWDPLCKLYKLVFEYLSENNFLVSQEWIPYENMVIPLMILLRSMHRADFSTLSEFQTKFVKYWYWASVFAGRYSGATNEIILADAKAMRSLAQNDHVALRQYLASARFQSQVEKPEDFTFIWKKGNAQYRGILNLINQASDGLRDFKNGGKLLFTSKLEEHHIFPKAYLKKLDPSIDDVIVDCVANKTLIPKLLNIKISAKAPSEYFGEVRTDNPTIIDATRTHLIDDSVVNGAMDNQFEQFLTDRSVKMKALVDDVLVKTRSEIDNTISGVSQ